jgi:Family of unknown function (DUF6057)
MSSNSTKETSYSRTISGIVFFAFYFLYFYFIVDPQLRFYAHTTLGDLHLFTQKEVLLIDLWKAPGQLSLLCADFILRFLVFKWAGPALFTVSGVYLFWITKQLTALINRKEVWGIAFLPVLLTFALPVEHDFIYVYVVPFYLALFFATLYVFLPNRAMVRIPVFLFFAGIVYFFGGNILFLYCAICLVYDLCKRKSLLSGLISLAVAFLVPFISKIPIWTTPLASSNSLNNYLWHEFSRLDFIILIVFVFSVPLSMLLAWILKRIAPGRGLLSPAEGNDMPARFISWPTGTLLCAGIALFGALILFDRNLNASIQCLLISGKRLWINEETMSMFPARYSVLIWFEIALSLLITWLVYIWYSRAHAKTRLAAFSILSLFNCYFLGVFVCFFAVACIIHDWLYKKKPLSIAVQIVAVIAVAFFFVIIAGNEWTRSFVRLSPLLMNRGNNAGLTILKMLRIFPLLAILFGMGIAIAWYQRAVPSDRTGGRLPVLSRMSIFLRRPFGRIGSEITSAFILISVSLVLGGNTFDAQRHTQFRLNYAARTGQWDKVLVEARYLSEQSLSDCVRLDINRALYQTGRMSDDFFIIPQLVNSVLPNVVVPHTRFQFAETWFELGWISPAEEKAYNVLAEGKHPLVLLLLAKIHLAKNQTRTARVFLRTLERQPGCSSWAKPYLDYLNHVPSPHVEEEINRYRLLAFKQEKIMEKHTTPLDLIETMLKENPKNRMAFEYWMAFNLLLQRQEQLSGNYHLLKELNVPGKHRLYQQAYVMTAEYNPAVLMDSIDVERSTRELFTRFNDTFANLAPDAPVLEALNDFRNTYFYHVVSLHVANSP